MISLLLAWALCAQASFFTAEGPKSVGRPKATPLRAEALLYRFQLEQAELVKSQGAELSVIPLWEDPRVNALAKREHQQWIIEVYGGLLTHPGIGEDELLLVLCHELGHHLAGPPKASRQGWSACEGQADFWAARNCGLMLANATESMLKLTRLYAEQGAGGFPQLETPEQRRVPRTFFGYPSPQCRLDTMVAGLSGEDRPACWYSPSGE